MIYIIDDHKKKIYDYSELNATKYVAISLVCSLQIAELPISPIFTSSNCGYCQFVQVCSIEILAIINLLFMIIDHVDK
jgi:hypothetical protein